MLFRNISLKYYNTFRLPCVADYVLPIEKIDDLYQAIEVSHRLTLPVYPIGSGSNLILPPYFKGIMLPILIPGKHHIKTTNTHHYFKIMAGENWNHIVNWAIQQKLYGIENLAGIPGTVGAAPIQNIGAYGVEIAELIESIDLFDTQTQTVKTFYNDQCDFTYRNSCFKKQHPHRTHIIISITLRLAKQFKPILQYPALAQHWETTINHSTKPKPANAETLKNLICAIRNEKLPDFHWQGNVGSFFENPTCSQTIFDNLKQTYPDLPGYTTNQPHCKKISAAWLIEKAGLKGFSINEQVSVSKQHALIIINNNNQAVQKEVLQLANIVQKTVQDQFNIKLKIEPNILL